MVQKRRILFSSFVYLKASLKRGLFSYPSIVRKGIIPKLFISI